MKKRSLDNVHIDELLDRAVRASCHELRLRSGQSPSTDLLGELSEYEALTPLDLQQMVYAILTDDQIAHLEHEGAIVFAYSLARTARFSVRAAHVNGGTEADFQVVANPT